MFIVAPNKLNIDSYISRNIKSFIFGLKDFSLFYHEITIEEIKALKKNNPEIELFISINRMIFNEDIDMLKERLLELDCLDIKGILFYDFSILYLKEILQLKTDLVWNQTHMVTNYDTVNYFYDNDCQYGIISPEITLEEIKEIKLKTNMKLMVNIFSKLPISFSKRKLLTNYFNHKELKRAKEKYFLHEKNQQETYKIIENESGTIIYTNDILNSKKAFKELVDMNIDYLILNSFDIDDDIFLKALDIYNEALTNDDALNNLDELIGTYQGFYFKKTIYKVK